MKQRWQFSLLFLFVVVTVAAVVSLIGKRAKDSVPRPIRIGDTLSVTTTGTNDNWGAYIVRQDGTIQMPTGPVPVAGCSDEETLIIIERHLKTIYREPSVRTLTVRRDGNGKIPVSGGPDSHTSHLRGYRGSY